MSGFMKSDDFGKMLLRIAVGGILLFHGIFKISHGVEWIKGPLVGSGFPAFLAYGPYLGEIVGIEAQGLGQVGARTADENGDRLGSMGEGIDDQMGGVLNQDRLIRLGFRKAPKIIRRLLEPFRKFIAASIQGAILPGPERNAGKTETVQQPPDVLDIDLRMGFAVGYDGCL